MTWAPTEVQKSIYSILSNDPDLVSLLGINKILDHVPDNSPYPYITMWIKPVENRDNESWDGVEIPFQINVWYKGPGRGDLPVQTIQKRIDELLHNKDISIIGWNVISLKRSTVDILTEPDNVTKHGIQIFNLLIGEE